MKNSLIIGIDTSNYTTSVSALSIDGELIANIKRPLPVKPGECGLRQSDAVFAHIKNLPSAMEELRDAIGDSELLAVAVSECPRRQVGSYMPCFLAGVACAESIAATSRVELYRFSHQFGHLMAAIYSSGCFDILSAPFGAMHISGGTTELLLCKYFEESFSAEIVGGTRDLNAGQAIDRVGVHMGLGFPCGAEIERLALEYNGKPINRRPSTDGAFLNLSGLVNMAQRLYDGGEDKTAVAHFLLRYLGRGIIEISRRHLDVYGDMPMLYAGGVMSNSILKGMLGEAIPNCYFAKPALSSDNAVGTAVLGLHRYKRLHSN